MPRKKEVINPDRVLDDQMRWKRGYVQYVSKEELRAYIIKYGPKVKTYSERPTIFNFWKIEEKYRPLIIKTVQYTGLLEISVYWIGEGRKHKKDEELTRIIGVSEDLKSYLED